MKQKLRTFLTYFGILPYIQVARERLFAPPQTTEAASKASRFRDFYTRFIKKGDLCFDVGAHRGHRTNIFLELGAKVVAFEPQPELSRYIKVKFGKKVVVRNIGLGSKSQEMDLYLSSSTALSTFSSEWVSKAQQRFKGVRWQSTRKVQVCTLDEMIALYGSPAFCKIDVEGYEFEVLKGLSTSIPHLSIEFMTPENSEILRNSLIHLFNINQQIRINYSQGDSLAFAFDEWLPFEEAMQIFENTLFKEPQWGDVYVAMR